MPFQYSDVVVQFATNAPLTGVNSGLYSRRSTETTIFPLVFARDCSHQVALRELT